MRKKDRLRKYNRFLLYLVVVVLLNLVGLTLFFRVDLTANRRYSLSSASREAVATLSEPLTINLFFTKNLPAPYNNIERYLRDLLAEYAIAGNRYFNYRFYDVSAEEGDVSDEIKRNQEIARDYGIYPVQIQTIEQDEVKFQNAYMGMVLIHGDIIEKIPAITSTDGLEYQITSLIQKMNNKISALLNLTENISVKLFLSSSLQIVGPYLNVGGLGEVPQDLQKMIERLNTKNYGRLSFSHLDPTVNPLLEKEAEKYNVLKLRWRDFRDSRGRIIKGGFGYAGIVVEYGNRAEEIQLIQAIRLPIFGTQYTLMDMKSIEESIEGIIENLIDANEKIGYLADHGTLKLPALNFMNRLQSGSDSISNFTSLLSRNYSIKDVRLKEGGIPGGIETLIIAGPREEFSDYELFQIDQFLMKGNSLALFLDAFDETVPSDHERNPYFASMGPVYNPINTGIEKLLKHYGIDIKKSYLMDENSFKQRVKGQFGIRARQIYYAPIIKDEFINHELNFLKNIKGLIVLKISPLILQEKRLKNNNLTAKLLFSSSDRSWEMSDRINLNPMFIHPPANDEDKQSYPLAYILEGSFRSYFADKPVPEKPGADKDTGDKNKKDKTEKKDVGAPEIETEGEILTMSRPARIFLIGTSEILKNNIIDEDGKGPNAMFVLNTIDYLNHRDAYIDMRSKTQQFNPLKDTKPGTKAFIKAFNVAGLPVFVVLSGLFVWLKRTARKKWIQQRFSK